MTTTSTIPAVKNALRARFAADPALAGVQVMRLDPFPDQPDDLQVVVANARPEDALRDSGFGAGQSSAAIGRRAREERYVIEVVCRVLWSRHIDAASAEDKAYALAAVVQQSVDAWAGETPPFGGLVRVALVVRTEDSHGIGDEKREARVTVGIGCSARINV